VRSSGIQEQSIFSYILFYTVKLSVIPIGSIHRIHAISVSCHDI
jgi:hypothetical protein